jgi:YtkA-like protein
MNRRAVIFVIATAAIGCGRASQTELERIRSGMVDVVLLSPRDALRHGKDAFVIEFRSASGGALVDVGQVRGSATMPMAGTPMFGTVDVQRTDVPGRYAANGDFSMAGTWRMTIQWDGPAGQGSVTFPGSVQ